MRDGLSVVIPAYNAATTLPNVIRDVVAIMKKEPYEIIVCNDGSQDATSVILNGLMRQTHQLRIVSHKTNKGIRDALEDLYAEARYPWVISFPADEECCAEDILKLYERRNAYDVVIGYRGLNKHPSFLRNMISFLYRFSVQALFGINTYDPGSMKLIRRDSIQNIPIISHSVFNEAERIIRIHRAGGKIGFIPITYIPKRFPQKKMSSVLKDAWLSFKDLVALKKSLG